MKRTAALALSFAAAIAIDTIAHSADAAGVFKCRGAGGRTVYQDRPCAAGDELRDFAHDPPAMSVIPFEFQPLPSPRPPRTERVPKPKPLSKADRRKLDAERRSDAEVAERRHVRDGMTDGEVLARLGSPDLQSGKGGRKTRWTYLPAHGDPQTVTVLRFEDGKVVGVERTILR